MYAKVMKKAAALLCVAVMIFFCAEGQGISVSAKEKDGTFTVICKDKNDPIVNMEWKIYRVGERGKDDSYNLAGYFKNYKVLLNHSDSSEAVQTGATLENYAVLDKVPPTASGRTDDDGTLKLEGLKNGLYIASGRKIRTDKKIHTPSVVMFEIHDTIKEGYTGKDVTAYIKMSSVTLSDDDMRFSYTVKNIWKNDDENDSRPSKVDVEIYRDNELYIEIELNEENDWTFQWSGEPDYEWRVRVDTVPQDYTMVYDKDETNFAVVNTYNPNADFPVTSMPSESEVTTVITQLVSGGMEVSTTAESVSTDISQDMSQTHEKVTSEKNKDDMTAEELPQTGQLWWPVLLFGGAGIIVLSCGIKLRTDGECDEDEEE